MKKIIFVLLALTVMTQLAFACPLHDGDGGAKGEKGSHSAE